MKKKITINKKKYALGGNHRAMMIWEAITGKAFDLKLLGDRLLYLYCLLLAADPEIDLTWDGFVTALDDDPTVEAQFLAAVNVAEKAAAIFEAEGNKREGDKKKD